MEEVITGTEAIKRYGTDNIKELEEYFSVWNEHYNAGNVPIYVYSLGGGLIKLVC